MRHCCIGQRDAERVAREALACHMDQTQPHLGSGRKDRFLARLRQGRLEIVMHNAAFRTTSCDAERPRST